MTFEVGNRVRYDNGFEYDYGKVIETLDEKSVKVLFDTVLYKNPPTYNIPNKDLELVTEHGDDEDKAADSETS